MRRWVSKLVRSARRARRQARMGRQLAAPLDDRESVWLDGG